MPNLATATSVFAASGLKTAPAGLFSRNPSVTTFGKVFQNCAALTTLPDGLFAGNPKVTTYSNALENCTALESVGHLFGKSTASAKCDRLFAGATALKSVPGRNLRRTDRGDGLQQHVLRCSALETIPAGLFAKNVNATTVAQCFLNCTRLTTVPSRLFEANTKTKTLTEMFSGCSGIEASRRTPSRD